MQTTTNTATQQMSTNEYVQNAIRTKSDKFFIQKEYNNEEHFVVTEDVLHGIEGIVGEYFEYIDHTDGVNMAEELGDIMWHVAIIINSLGFDWDFYDRDALLENVEIEKSIEKVQDMSKKRMFYGKEYSMDEFESYLWAITCWVILTCEENDLDFSKVLYTNIEKLRERFPDKFTQENATERDLENERESLEKNLQ